MGMANTSYGDGGFRGCADEETDLGIFIGSASLTSQEDVVEVLDHGGEVNGVGLGNESATLSCSGVTVTAATLGVTIGSAVGTWANSAMEGPSGISDYFVTSVTLERSNQGWETGSFEARGWINVAAS